MYEDHESLQNSNATSTNSSSKKRRLLKKAPTAPKRFKSAYICFIGEKMESKFNSTSHVKVTDTMKVLANQWKELPLQEKKKYELLAEADKARYFEEMKNYSGPMQVPNKRLKKNPNAPKRAMSAFLSFSQQMRQAVRLQYPTLKNTDISSVLAQMWRDAPDVVKRPHLERELQERQKYHEDMGRWKEAELERSALQDFGSAHSSNSQLYQEDYEEEADEVDDQGSGKEDDGNNFDQFGFTKNQQWRQADGSCTAQDDSQWKRFDTVEVNHTTGHRSGLTGDSEMYVDTYPDPGASTGSDYTVQHASSSPDSTGKSELVRGSGSASGSGGTSGDNSSSDRERRASGNASNSSSSGVKIGRNSGNNQYYSKGHNYNTSSSSSNSGSSNSNRNSSEGYVAPSMSKWNKRKDMKLGSSSKLSPRLRAGAEVGADAAPGPADTGSSRSKKSRNTIRSRDALPYEPGFGPFRGIAKSVALQKRLAEGNVQYGPGSVALASSSSLTSGPRTQTYSFSTTAGAHGDVSLATHSSGSTRASLLKKSGARYPRASVQSTAAGSEGVLWTQQLSNISNSTSAGSVTDVGYPHSGLLLTPQQYQYQQQLYQQQHHLQQLQQQLNMNDNMMLESQQLYEQQVYMQPQDSQMFATQQYQQQKQQQHQHEQLQHQQQQNQKQQKLLSWQINDNQENARDAIQYFENNIYGNRDSYRASQSVLPVRGFTPAAAAAVTGAATNPKRHGDSVSSEPSTEATSAADVWPFNIDIESSSAGEGSASGEGSDAGACETPVESTHPATKTGKLDTTQQQSGSNGLLKASRESNSKSPDYTDYAASPLTFPTEVSPSALSLPSFSTALSSATAFYGAQALHPDTAKLMNDNNSSGNKKNKKRAKRVPPTNSSSSSSGCNIEPSPDVSQQVFLDNITRKVTSMDHFLPMSLPGGPSAVSGTLPCHSSYGLKYDGLFLPDYANDALSFQNNYYPSYTDEMLRQIGSSEMKSFYNVPEINSYSMSSQVGQTRQSQLQQQAQQPQQQKEQQLQQQQKEQQQPAPVFSNFYNSSTHLSLPISSSHSNLHPHDKKQTVSGGSAIRHINSMSSSSSSNHTSKESELSGASGPTSGSSRANNFSQVNTSASFTSLSDSNVNANSKSSSTHTQSVSDPYSNIKYCSNSELRYEDSVERTLVAVDSAGFGEPSDLEKLFSLHYRDVITSLPSPQNNSKKNDCKF